MSIEELKAKFKDILITWQAEVKRRLSIYDRESIGQYEEDLCSLVDELSEAAIMLSKKKSEDETERINKARADMKRALNSNYGHSDCSIKTALVKIEMDFCCVQ